MCETKPGPRCATDAAASAQATLDAYTCACPDGPPVNAHAAAQALLVVTGRARWVEDPTGQLVMDLPDQPDSDTFRPQVPGIPGDGSPVVLDVDEERGLTFTWHDISRRRQDWTCRDRGYLVSRLSVTDATGTEVGGLNVTHTTPELVDEELPTSFHWADENTGYSFGFPFRRAATKKAAETLAAMGRNDTPLESPTAARVWAAAYSALKERPPSARGKATYSLSASDAPADRQTLLAELAVAEEKLDRKVEQFKEFLSVPFIDYAELDRTATAPDGTEMPLRGTGTGQRMYRLAAGRLAQQGKVLRASGIQTDEAQAVWRRMAADPETRTTEVTVRYFDQEPKTYVCLDYRDASVEA